MKRDLNSIAARHEIAARLGTLQVRSNAVKVQIREKESRLVTSRDQNRTTILAAALASGKELDASASRALADQISDLYREAGAVQEAIRILRDDLERIDRVEGWKLCEQARPELSLLLREELKLGIALADVQRRKTEFIDEFHRAGISTCGLLLSNLVPSIGSVGDENSLLGSFAKDIARDHGVKA